MTDGHSPRRPRRRRIGLVVVALIVAVLALVGWLAVRGWMAKGELEAVRALEPRLVEAYQAQDAAALVALTDEAHLHGARAAELTSDPIWRSAEAVPVAGANVRAVRVVAESLRDITGTASPVLGEVTAPTSNVTSGLDVTALDRLAEPLGALASAVGTANGELSALPVGDLIGPVRDAAVTLRDAVASVTAPLGQAAQSARVLPGMLGADGPRTLLVMVQNSAEIRTGGGITGSFIALRADGGHLHVVDRADSSEFPRLDEPILTLPGDLRALYGTAPGRFVMNATMTPDFDLSARLGIAWWQARGGATPDAVIAIDPHVLAALVSITGPLTLADGTVITADDVIQDVLVKPYLDRSAAAQTMIQQEVTDRLFATLTTAPIDPIAWARALSSPTAEGRISVWSAHADEEDVLAAGPLGGTLARYRSAPDGAVGVYFNDATTGKMDTFLHARVAPSTRVCRADGAAEVAVAVSLRSSAPAEARTYAPSMVGGFHPGEPGDITTDVTTMVPAGWFFAGADLDGAALKTTDVDSGEYPSSLARVTLAPGEEHTMVFHFVAGTASVHPTIVHTPMMNDVDVTPSITTACG